MLLEHTLLHPEFSSSEDNDNPVRPVLCSMLEVGLSLLRARCGTHDPHSLTAVLRFVAWAVPTVAISEADVRPVVAELVTFATATRSVAETASAPVTLQPSHRCLRQP